MNRGKLVNRLCLIITPNRVYLVIYLPGRVDGAAVDGDGHQVAGKDDHADGQGGQDGQRSGRDGALGIRCSKDHKHQGKPARLCTRVLNKATQIGGSAKHEAVLVELT